VWRSWRIIPATIVCIIGISVEGEHPVSCREAGES
jgi:hypothetical protein